MNEQRGEPVTLEEMTRRRDGWRARCEGALGVIRTLKRDRDALAEQVRLAELKHASCNVIIGRLGNELAASQAEARRFAEECGRLRDQLGGKS